MSPAAVRFKHEGNEPNYDDADIKSIFLYKSPISAMLFEISEEPESQQAADIGRQNDIG